MVGNLAPLTARQPVSLSPEFAAQPATPPLAIMSPECELLSMAVINPTVRTRNFLMS